MRSGGGNAPASAGPPTPTTASVGPPMPTTAIASASDLRIAIARAPDAWKGYYIMACLEARFGDGEEAIANLRRSVELDAAATKTAAAGDTDLDSIRGRPDYPV